MKVLIADDDPRHRDLLHHVLREEDVEVAWEAVDAEASPKDVIARELRRILDDCPICGGGFRDHSYALLAAVVIDEQRKAQKRLQQLFGLLQEHRWHEFLRLREWEAFKDAVDIFAFRCDRGRIGILTVLSPVEENSMDFPLHFAILTLQEGNRLQALIAAKRWMPLRPSGSQH